MKKIKLSNKSRFSIVLVLTVLFTTILSIPLTFLGPIAPLGDILLPGSGVWRVPGEVASQETLYITNLTSPVKVFRDEWGVPHIYAANEDDMSFALGYVHAQDRLFQMDMARRQVRGMLSEILGDMMLESDKYNIAMGMEYWANETLKALIALGEAGEITYLSSFYKYVEGINYYIDTHMHELPIEYAIVGFKPVHWSLLDSLCFSKYMSKMLTWSYSDLYRLLNYEALGASDYNELFPLEAPYQIPICPNYGSYNFSEPLGANIGGPQPSSSVMDTISAFLSNVEKIPSEREAMDAQEQQSIGSNNWVIDGNKSSTGKPILCNDMHLGWNVPGIWYQVHLVSEDFGMNNYGFTLAGVPLPLVGQNPYVAWGFTNTGYDVLDWYYYTEVDADHYNYNGASTAYTKRTRTINIKGQAPIEFTVKETVHGPVLSDFLDKSTVPPSINQTTIVIAPKWTGNNITYELRALYGFNHAKNRTAFNQASKYFENPAQNIVYADVDGNIGIRPTGKVPIRNNNGTFPYSGSNGEGEWQGYIPFGKLPRTENPTQHYLVSANQKAVGPDYTKYFLQNSYAAGYRARRINELLNESADGTVGVEKMKEIQLDIVSKVAEVFVPYLINATETILPKNSTVLNILTQLKNWNYKMDKNLAAPTIYRKWRDLLIDYTFNDEFTQAKAGIKPSLNVLEKLMENETSKWFDDITTTSKVETRDDIIIKALYSTIGFLMAYYATNEITSWRWGGIHKLYFEHLGGLGTLSAGPFEGDGEGYTVNPAGADISNGLGLARWGASERFIVDFSNLNNSQSCIPSGQRGITNSKHYTDQLEQLFLLGKYHFHHLYSKSEYFPALHIESQIDFLPPTENTEWVIYLTTFIVVGLIIGVVSVLFLRYRKKNEKKPKVQEKRKLSGGEGKK